MWCAAALLQHDLLFLLLLLALPMLSVTFVSSDCQSYPQFLLSSYRFLPLQAIGAGKQRLQARDIRSNLGENSSLRSVHSRGHNIAAVTTQYFLYWRPLASVVVSNNRCTRKPFVALKYGFSQSG